MADLPGFSFTFIYGWYQRGVHGYEYTPLLDTFDTSIHKVDTYTGRCYYQCVYVSHIDAFRSVPFHSIAPPPLCPSPIQLPTYLPIQPDRMCIASHPQWRYLAEGRKPNAPTHCMCKRRQMMSLRWKTPRCEQCALLRRRTESNLVRSLAAPVAMTVNRKGKKELYDR